MIGFKVVNLQKMIELVGEESVKRILSTFLCPLNPDVERFLKTKAVDFAKQGWAQTHLVYGSFCKEMVLLGYFTLADKYIHIYPNKNISNTLMRRVRNFSRRDEDLGCYFMSTPLIGQIGKNFANGGKFTYLECEDKPILVDFYMRNGFYNFGRRELDKEEINDFETSYLIQMLKYLK